MSSWTWADGDVYEPYIGRWSREVASISPELRQALRGLLRSRLPEAAHGSIALSAGAWTVAGCS